VAACLQLAAIAALKLIWHKSKSNKIDRFAAIRLGAFLVPAPLIA
jgi:hypothetical protein